MLSSTFSFRISNSERSLLEDAASQARVKLSEFIRNKAIEGAEEELLNRTSIEIPAENWAKFESLMNAPSKEIPAVKELFKEKPVWE